MHRLGFLLTLIAASAVACGDDGDDEVVEVEVEAPAEPEETESPETEEDDPLVGLDDPEALAEAMPEVTSALTEDVEVPARGCAFADEGAVRLWQRPGIATIVEVGDGFAIAGYARKEEGEEIFLLTLTPGQPPRPVLRADLEVPLQTARVAAPGLAARDGGHVGLALTDRRARVRYARVDITSSHGRFVDVGNGADQRYAPAIAFTGGDDLLAWADGSGDRARVRLSQITGGTAVGESRDVTPAAGGATAPMVLGDALLFVDHRQGISNLYRVVLPDGEPDVLRAVSHLYDPVSLAGARWGDRWLVGYTAVGMGAKTAVGLVVADGTETPPPQPIVPSAGYGMLHVGAAKLGQSVVFVADAPTAPEREAPRRLDVRVAGSDATLGDALVISGPEAGPPGASFGDAAAHAGIVGVVFSAADGIYLRLVRCDPGAG